MIPFSTVSYLSVPLTFFGIQSNSREPRRVIRSNSSVLCIFGWCSFSKIRNSIINGITIYMVYMFGREAPVNVKPRKSMGKIRFTFDHNLYPAVGSISTGLTFMGIKLIMECPSEHSGFGVIVKKFFEALLRNGHDQLRKLSVYVVSGSLHGRGVQSLNLAGQWVI